MVTLFQTNRFSSEKQQCIMVSCNNIDVQSSFRSIKKVSQTQQYDMVKFNPFDSSYKGITGWMSRRVMIYIGIILVILILYRHFILG